jgi:hypothetical protein
MSHHQYIWVSAKHGEIPCTVRQEIGENYVIRLDDFYDLGEMEITVPSGQVFRLVEKIGDAL